MVLMTYEDKWKAINIIYGIFVCDTTDVLDWEISRRIGELALLDLNKEEYDDIKAKLDEHITKKLMVHHACTVNLLKSINNLQ